MTATNRTAASNGRAVKANISAAADAAHDAVDRAEDVTTDAVDRVEAEAEDAGSALKRTADKARDMAANVSHDVQAKVADTAASLKGQAETRAADVRDALTETGDRLAQSLRRAAEADRTPPVPARVLSTAADSVSYATDHLRGTTLNDMTATIRSSAQRNPGLFAAGAALAGFAIARFLMASRGAADRR